MQNWQTYVGAAYTLRNQLEQRQRELAKVMEGGIDKALCAHNPIAALRQLALYEIEQAVIAQALERVEEQIEILKQTRKPAPEEARRSKSGYFAHYGRTIR